MFDLYLYPFGIKNKQEYSKIPGFLISTAPKKTSRNRMDDIFLLYYTNYEEIRPTELEFLTQILPKTRDHYFKTSGPITTAIKKSAEFLNDQILQFNLKQLKRPNLVGALQIMVMHENEAYLMHAGEVTSFLLSRNGSERHYDPTIGSQGIGVSRGLRYKFHHVSINTGDRIVLVSKPPKKWTINSMSGSTRLSISHLRRLLISETDQDFETVVIQFRPGNRSVHILKLNTDSVETRKSPIQPISESIDELVNPTNQKPSEKTTIDPAYIPSANLEEIPIETPSSESIENLPISTFQEKRDDDWSESSIESQQENDFKEEQPASESLEKKEPKEQGENNDLGRGIFISGKRLKEYQTKRVKKERTKPRINQDQIVAQLIRFRAVIRKFSNNVTSLLKKIENGLVTLYARSTPGDINQKPSLSGTGMLFVALIVPIFVVAVALTVYLQNKTEIHQEKILEARNQVNLAVESEDYATKVAYYQSALDILDEAETYGSSDASNDLRYIVQSQLDSFSGITRIDIQPTVAGGLVKKISITKMVTALGEDVYALDESTGHVIRMMATKPDFTIDNDFICGPGKHGEVIVSNLVDIEPVTVQNSEDISIMGIDENGVLLLCSTRGTPIAIRLQTPDLGWGNIQAIAFNGYSLFVLDNGINTRDIYAYEGNALSFNGAPATLFEQNIPEILPIVIDMTLYQEDLYLLRDNGMLSRCNVGNNFIETKCNADIGYGRIQLDQVREVVPVIENTQMNQLFITQPPDPSIYLLDTQGQAVYHFSLAVNLQKQIKPNLNSLLFQPERPLSAVTVSPSGTIHFAYGHQTYFGELP
ncbi:MAG: hypothetical protein CL609_06535 [Anaerolineaceae bacterium]|nr:hypothetical protein [Anaerolineaceae bacterium]